MASDHYLEISTIRLKLKRAPVKRYQRKKFKLLRINPRINDAVEVEYRTSTGLSTWEQEFQRRVEASRTFKIV